MSHQAGVRTVTVGGLPQQGPMQAASGSRGAAAYSADALDDDFDYVNQTLHDINAYSRLPNREDNSMWTNFLGITLRNQVREGDPTPLQFLFQAADCRIYYTLENVYNMSQLWRDAAYSTWNDPSACVSDSTDYPTARNATSIKLPPTTAVQALKFNYGLILDSPTNLNSTFDLLDGGNGKPRKLGEYAPCVEGTSGCKKMNVDCPRGVKKVWAFSKKCMSALTCPGIHSTCAKSVPAASKDNVSFNKNGLTPIGGEPPVRIGWCETSFGYPELCGNS